MARVSKNEVNKRITEYEEKYPELCKYVENNVYVHQDKKIKVVSAPVKCGKRKMVQVHYLYSRRDNRKEHTILVTALHRKADKPQYDEFKSMGIYVFTINTKTKVEKLTKHVNEILKNDDDMKITIHLDELDYGAGNTQLLSNIWKEYKANPKVFLTLYSATPDVAKRQFITSGSTDQPPFYDCEKYEPPPTYHGIMRLIKENKIVEAQLFFTLNESGKIEVGEQGLEAIKELKAATKDEKDDRHLMVLRLTNSIKVDDKMVPAFSLLKSVKNEFEEEHEVELEFVGTNDKVLEWSDYRTWRNYSKNVSIIIVVNQVASRSTEWMNHPFLVNYHTYRSETTCVATCIQAQERIAYFEPTYDVHGKPNIDIKVYGDMQAAKYSAGMISYDDLEKKNLSTNLTKKKKGKVSVRGEVYPANDWQDALKIINEYYEENGIKKDVNKIHKSNYIKDEYKLKRCMKRKDKTYEIAEWENHKEKEGFYLSNIRSSRSRFVTGKSLTLKDTLLKLSDIEKNKDSAVSENTPYRIYVYYDVNETDPENYKFGVVLFEENLCSKVVNKSMYENSDRNDTDGL
jgi:hypothetical protein